MLSTLYRQMKLLLSHCGIETTEIPEGDLGYGGPPPPPRRASEGLGPRMDTPPTAPLSQSSWPSGGGVKPRGQVGGVVTGSQSRSHGFASAFNSLQVHL